MQSYSEQARQLYYRPLQPSDYEALKVAGSSTHSCFGFGMFTQRQICQDHSQLWVLMGPHSTYTCSPCSAHFAFLQAEHEKLFPIFYEDIFYQKAVRSEDRVS